MLELSENQVRALRTRAQNLHPRAGRGALTEVVRAVCGIQAQLWPAMLLALRTRVSGLTVQDVETAIDPGRTVVRTWAMRGTLHLLAREDLNWMVALLGPAFAAKGRRRRLELGLTDDLARNGLAAIQKILSQNGPLTRGELVERLAGYDITLERKSQAPIHLIGLAALERMVCLGPDRSNGESTYVLLERWLDHQTVMERDAALAELARRYLTSYGPASLKDFAGWSGLPLAESKRGWQAAAVPPDFVEARLGDLALWLPASAAGGLDREASESAPPVVRLLPAFDSYVLGYANRDHLVRREHQPEVYHGGQTVPVVLVDGLAAGVWRYERQARRMTIRARAFDAFDTPIQQGIAEEAEDIGRFFGLPVSVITQT